MLSYVPLLAITNGTMTQSGYAAGSAPDSEGEGATRSGVEWRWSMGGGGRGGGGWGSREGWGSRPLGEVRAGGSKG